jgi:hypothetical protein
MRGREMLIERGGGSRKKGRVKGRAIGKERG